MLKTCGCRLKTRLLGASIVRRVKHAILADRAAGPGTAVPPITQALQPGRSRRLLVTIWGMSARLRTKLQVVKVRSQSQALLGRKYVGSHNSEGSP